MRLALLVAALGYFVDVFDIWLYSVYRVSSLTALGYSGEALTQHSTLILNAQMLGMILGGLVFGVMGDKLGRKASLFGSILIYASATIANGFVNSAETYALARLVAGFGLAGELGAGVALTMEIMPKQHRGWAPAVIAGFGLFGCVAAALISDFIDWRTGYIVGGSLGFLLFLLRVKVAESGLYTASRAADVRYGALTDLLLSATRRRRYLLCIMIGMPVWFVSGIMLIFAPELGRELGVTAPVIAGHAILYFSVALAIGDVACGYVSQRLRSRRKALLGFLLILAACCLGYFTLRELNLAQFYALLCLVGFFTGYWAVFMATVTEQFGTNLRATAATTVPNFVRGSVLLMTFMLGLLKPHLGLTNAALTVGCIVMTLALTAAVLLPESFDKELDYLEK
ncbi:MAG: MFS transporter [Alphaproteobacteria bacterium]|nr:MFS transporter [Alphaproteobacteria bacterium]